MWLSGLEAHSEEGRKKGKLNIGRAGLIRGFTRGFHASQIALCRGIMERGGLLGQAEALRGGAQLIGED